MRVTEPRDKFLEKLFKGGLNSRSFLITGEKEEREKFRELLAGLLLCEKKTFCKKCESCQAKSELALKIYQGPALKIEEAREIHAKAHETSWLGTKIFIIETDAIGPEAQGTLLKVMEEPHADTYFIISLASGAELLGPLLSRLTPLWVGGRRDKEEILKNFSKPGIAKWLEAAVSFSKDPTKIENFFSELEILAEEKLKKPEGDFKAIGAFLEDLLAVKTRFSKKTYFNRMLLEHILISKAVLK